MTILITGASGFLGSQLAQKLAETHNVVCLSRSRPKNGLPFVRGAFDSFEDLRGLDGYAITAAVHLAAVTGGSTEEDALSVNVLGTRRLLRYLLDRGCRKFVIASSIAAVGCLDRSFLPERFPIADDHPCMATDAYGLSKAMSEELTRYFARIHPDADFIQLRFGAIQPDDWAPQPVLPAPDMEVPITALSRVLAADAVDAVGKALASPPRPGVRVYNVVGPDATCDAPVTEMLRTAYGEEAMARFDLTYYGQPHHAFKPLFAMDKIKRELGHEPVRTTIPLRRAGQAGTDSRR